MSLADGTRLGAYEVIALLGSGGMGERPRWCAALQIAGLAIARLHNAAE